MSFDPLKITTLTKKIIALPDQPNMQPDELKQYFDSSPEELRAAINALCDALTAPTASANLGFAQTAGIPASTIQAALEHLHQQLTNAVMGQIPSGSVTGDKLAQDVRNRFSAIEAAAESEQSTRASADSALDARLSAAETALLSKCEVYIGTYSGNGAEQRTISLGFTPKAVLLMSSDGSAFYRHNYTNYLYGGLATPASPVTCTFDDVSHNALDIVTGGFRVYRFSHTDGYINTNYSGTNFVYLALK